MMAALVPRAEPQNPCTCVFWKRHFGTDALVGSYLFLFSSIVYLAYAVYLVLTDTSTTMTAVMSWGNLTSATGFFVGSVYFCKLSYPEVGVAMVTRALREDASKMSWTTKYFTHNEMLIAIWGFQLGFAPYFVIAAFYAYYGDYFAAAAYGVSTVLLMGLMCFWLVAAMPHNMQRNGGQGSSYFYDAVCCCPRRGSPSEAFWRTHLGSDFLAGSWIFCVAGVLATLGVLAAVWEDPDSLVAWCVFLSTAPFGVGSVLFVRSAYPSTANSSICCGPLSYDEEDHRDAGWTTPDANQKAPLLAKMSQVMSRA